MDGVKGARTWAAAAALGVVLLAAYAPALRGDFLWDDDFYVSRNPVLQGADGLFRIWFDPGANPQYYPLTFTTFWIEHLFWGLDPFGYHLGNVLLHAAGALLLGLLLRRLEVPGALVAAAVWALHPLQVESVAWITERKNTLSGLLAFGSALAFFRFAGVGDERDAPKSTRWAALAALLYAGALLSKSVTASLPAVLAVLLVWKKGRLPRRAVPWLLGMLAVGAIYGVGTAWLEVHQVGAQGNEWALGPAGRLVLSGKIFWFYLGKIVWPVPLSFSYGLWEIDPSRALSWIPLLAAAAVAVGCAVAARKGRGGPLVALLAYGITLSPALGFLNVYPMRYAYVADHFQYLAGIAPIALLVAASARLLRGHAALPVAAAVLALLSWRSWVEAREYRDLDTLWRETLRTSPRAWLASWNLGKTLAERGEFEEAEALFRKTLEIKPDHADARNEIGTIRLQEGNVDEALAEFEAARALDPEWPITWFNLGSAREAAGDLAGAEDAFREAIRHAPRIVNRYRGGVSPLPWRAEVRLARLLLAAGRTEDAAEALRGATASNPRAAEPHALLGNLHAAAGRSAEAERAYREALARDPRDPLAHYNLGLLLDERGDVRGAASAYRAAVTASPGMAVAWNNLAVALFHAGDVAGAREAASRAAALGLPPHPDFARALAGRAP